MRSPRRAATTTGRRSFRNERRCVEFAPGGPVANFSLSVISLKRAANVVLAAVPIGVRLGVAARPTEPWKGGEKRKRCAVFGSVLESVEDEKRGVESLGSSNSSALRAEVSSN